MIYVLLCIISFFPLCINAMENANHVMQQRKMWLMQSLKNQSEYQKQLESAELPVFKKLWLQTSLQIENRRIESLQIFFIEISQSNEDIH